MVGTERANSINSKNLLVIFENQMSERFRHLNKDYGFLFFECGLINRSHNSVFSDLLTKLKNKKMLFLRYQRMLNVIDVNAITCVYVSSAEGYIAHNMLKWLKKDRPNLPLIALQHGLFPFQKALPIVPRRALINNFFRCIFGFYPWGKGFGGKLTDKYIVYNQKVKDYLVGSRGWKKEDVIVDLALLKGRAGEEKTKPPLARNVAVFFPQCLFRSGLCTDLVEKQLLRDAIEYIKQKHDSVIVKNHPACPDLIGDIDGVTVCDNIDIAFRKSEFAYSFFSTALFDAKIYGLDVTALYHSRMICFRNFDVSIYENFEKVEVVG